MEDSVHLRLDTEDEHEVQEYRTTFDGNGYPERDTPVPETAISARTGPVDGQATLRLLWERLTAHAEAIQSLQVSHARLQSQLEHRLAIQQRFALATAVVVLSLCAAGLLWVNGGVGRQVEETSEGLQLSVQAAQDDAKSAQNSVAKTQTGLASVQRQFDDRLQTQATVLQAQAKEIESLNRALEEEQKAHRETARIAGLAQADVERRLRQLDEESKSHQAEIAALRATAEREADHIRGGNPEQPEQVAAKQESTANDVCSSPDCEVAGRRLVVNNYTKSSQRFVVNGVVRELPPGQSVFQITGTGAVSAHLESEPVRSWTDWRKRKDGDGEELVIGIDDSPRIRE